MNSTVQPEPEIFNLKVPQNVENLKMTAFICSIELLVDLIFLTMYPRPSEQPELPVDLLFGQFLEDVEAYLPVKFGDDISTRSQYI